MDPIVPENRLPFKSHSTYFPLILEALDTPPPGHNATTIVYQAAIAASIRAQIPPGVDITAPVGHIITFRLAAGHDDGLIAALSQHALTLHRRGRTEDAAQVMALHRMFRVQRRDYYIALARRPSQEHA